jgi:hypothetical protein
MWQKTVRRTQWLRLRSAYHLEPGLLTTEPNLVSSVPADLEGFCRGNCQRRQSCADMVRAPDTADGRRQIVTT